MRSIVASPIPTSPSCPSGSTGACATMRRSPTPTLAAAECPTASVLSRQFRAASSYLRRNCSCRGKCQDVCARLEQHKAPEGVAPAGACPPPIRARPSPDATVADRRVRTRWRHDAGALHPIPCRRQLAVHGGVIPLVSRAWIDSIDGRNAFGRATMRDSDGNVLSEASGLTIKLLPHQP